MRKNCARKILHAVLDLLPLILIPVFMIYSHRHKLTDVTAVDIQYKYESNEVNSNDDLIIGNIYHLVIDDQTADAYLRVSDFITIDILETSSYDFSAFSSDAYLEEFLGASDDLMSPINNQIYFDGNAMYFNYYINERADVLSSVFVGNPSDYSFSLDCICVLKNCSIYFTNVYEIFSYTDYNVIDYVQVDDSTSSILNVFMNNFIDTTNRYFNFNQLFNMNDVYTWINTNLFQNNAPLIVSAVWNIIVYEFFMDLIYLLYAVFMFIIDFATGLLDKPFNTINRRR